jgi:hypothetical protein
VVPIRRQTGWPAKKRPPSHLAERFLAELADAKRKANTALEYSRLLDRVILPTLIRRRVMDVTRRDVAKLHHDLRETPYQANRLLAVLSKMFNLAEPWACGPMDRTPAG